MTVRIVPESIDGLISLSTQCIGGVAALAALLNIKQNSLAAITADHYDLVGPPGSNPATAGKRGELNQKRHAFLEAQSNRQLSFEASRNYNARALDHLKGYLGRRWNPRWQAAGFAGGSLALPRDPLPLLLQFRAYFGSHPTHEHADNGITAAEADARATAIQQATAAEAAANVARQDARIARDAAFDTLHNRIIGLRYELDQLLDSDDLRWCQFGFARPIDRRIPKRVPAVALRLGGAPGEVIVEWPTATGAENYRVTRQIVEVDPAPVGVGIFNDRTALLAAMPSGKNVIVRVSARNPTGESQPAQATISIP